MPGPGRSNADADPSSDADTDSDADADCISWTGFGDSADPDQSRSFRADQDCAVLGPCRAATSASRAGAHAERSAAGGPEQVVPTVNETELPGHAL